MSQIKYLFKNIEISYFDPQQGNVLLLKPTRKTNKDNFKLLKRQLETSLQVDSIKTQNGAISMKLSKHVQPNVVGEYLRSIGAEGGEQIEDAASVAEQPAKDSVEQQQENEPENPPAPAPQQMGQNQPPTAPLNAGREFGKVFNLLYEKNFFSPNKSKKFDDPARPGRRTGKYWEELESVTGKNRQKITSKDVLSIRRKYSKKPENEDRNKVLRSLDSAFSFFHRKLKEENGLSAAKKFAEDYYAVDNLKPKDYSDEISLEKAREDDDSMQTSELNEPNFVDFSDMFDDESDEETYDDIQVEKPTF